MWKDVCWKETLFWEELPVAELEMGTLLPMEHSRGADRIGRYFARLAAVWYRYWTGRFYRAACDDCAGAREAARTFWPWRARLSTALTYEDERVCSLWVQGSEWRGGGKERAVRTAMTWTRRDGCPVALEELFSGERRWRRRVLEQVERELQSMRREGVALRRDAEQRAKSRFSSRRFYLTSEGPVLYYPMGVLGSAESGILTFPLRLGTKETEEDNRKIPEKV